MRVKHINSPFKKKIGYGLAVFGVIIFFAYLIHISLVNFVQGIELGAAFIIVGLLIAKYQVMPEGEPDVEVSPEEMEDKPIEVFDRNSFVDSGFGVYDDTPTGYYDEFTDRPKENPMLTEAKEILKEIESIEGLNFDVLKEIEKGSFLVEKIQSFDYDFSEELMEAVIKIFKTYLEALQSGNKEEEEKIKTELPNVIQALDYIYQDTHGAMVYRTQKNVIAFSNEI